MMTARNYAWLMLAGILLAGCSARSATTPAAVPTATLSLTTAPSPTVNPTLANTLIPSLTPTLTPTPGPSPTTGPTPAFGTGVVTDDFLFGSQPPGCELPCWQGLNPGESNAGDIQVVFDRVFSLHGRHDFFAPGSVYASTDDQIPGGSISTAYSWDFGSTATRADYFAITAHVNTASRVLEGIEFRPGADRFRPYASPQQVLKELGKPTLMLASRPGSEMCTAGTMQLLMAYDRGVVLSYELYIYPIVFPRKACVDGTFTLCLDNLKGLYKSYPDTTIYLTETFSRGLTTITPPQRALIGSLLDESFVQNNGLVPFAEIFGQTPEQVSQLVQSSNEVCLTGHAP